MTSADATKPTLGGLYVAGAAAVLFLAYAKGVDVGTNREKASHVAADKRHLAADKAQNAKDQKVRDSLAQLASTARIEADSVSALQRRIALRVEVGDSTHLVIHRTPELDRRGGVTVSTGAADTSVTVPREATERIQRDDETIARLTLALAQCGAVATFDSATVLPNLRATIATADTTIKDVGELTKRPGVFSDAAFGATVGALVGGVTGPPGAVTGAVVGGTAGAIIHLVFRR